MSQVPKRCEPSSSGEINYQYIFQLLKDLGYNQWIGCEYHPQGIINSFLSFDLFYGSIKIVSFPCNSISSVPSVP